MDYFTNYFINTITRHYADFKGRASRSEFWFFVLFYVITRIVIGVVDEFLPGLWGFPILSNLYSLALLLPLVAITARRLHDIGKSGWLQLIAVIPWSGSVIFMIVGLVGLVDKDAAAFSASSFSYAIFALVLSLVAILGSIVLIVLATIDSGKGSNRYGPSPRKEEADDDDDD